MSNLLNKTEVFKGDLIIKSISHEFIVMKNLLSLTNSTFTQSKEGPRSFEIILKYFINQICKCFMQFYTLIMNLIERSES